MLNTSSSFEIYREFLRWRFVDAIECVQQPHHHLALVWCKFGLLSKSVDD